MSGVVCAVGGFLCPSEDGLHNAAEIMGNAQGETTVLNSVLTRECYTSLRINSVLET